VKVITKRVASAAFDEARSDSLTAARATSMNRANDRDPAALVGSITATAARVTHRNERGQPSTSAQRAITNPVPATTIAAVRAGSAEIFGSRTWVSRPTSQVAPTRPALITPATFSPKTVNQIDSRTRTRDTQVATLVVRNRMASIIALSQRWSA
jgi:hypothetical protein